MHVWKKTEGGALLMEDPWTVSELLPEQGSGEPNLVLYVRLDTDSQNISIGPLAPFAAL